MSRLRVFKDFFKSSVNLGRSEEEPTSSLSLNLTVNQISQVNGHANQEENELVTLLSSLKKAKESQDSVSS